MRDTACPGTVYQITESCPDVCYVGCLIVTSEVKSWGIQGYIAVPQQRDEPPSLIYLRCPWDWLEYIGTVDLVVEDREVPNG